MASRISRRVYGRAFKKYIQQGKTPAEAKILVKQLHKIDHANCLRAHYRAAKDGLRPQIKEIIAFFLGKNAKSLSEEKKHQPWYYEAYLCAKSGSNFEVAPSHKMPKISGKFLTYNVAKCSCCGGKHYGEKLHVGVAMLLVTDNMSRKKWNDWAHSAQQQGKNLDVRIFRLVRFCSDTF